ncbi:hypothetical protein Tco_0702371 [Tanacetum coccineum]|uniref:Reverse transcriptase domain-containing protein n=1 Tax=Tanacetum coccineum TaxID=301880 RepID=A0ABQ4XWT7_9ASTR
MIVTRWFTLIVLSALRRSDKESMLSRSSQIRRYIKMDVEKNKNHGNQAGNGEAQARAYASGGNKPNPDSNVVTELGSFDIITGMDWLSLYYALIICDEKIDVMSFWHISLQKKPEDKSEEKRLEDVPVVQDFPEDFLGTDIAKITRKEPKPDKNKHENGKSTQEPNDPMIRRNKGLRSKGAFKDLDPSTFAYKRSSTLTHRDI